jgi:hypothetical protein
MRLSVPTREPITHTGSPFDDFLDEGNLKNEVEAAAMKKVLAWQSQNLAPSKS